ncbi:helix-turn-helix transcriptional regulator [Halomarina ordinaria]|uniref:Helix-turn-helix transcriptional regulator n=1 Tax=Halomarina ordinaria TaxID=3033939 RepID=A0ABD5U9Z4_9EURY|nr:hypothetical protein [Halomarina sp. PSRA2]
MRTGSRLALCLALCLLVVGAAPVTQATQQRAAPVDSGTTTIAIHVEQNGDARFVVETQYELNGTDETAAFRDVGEDFEAGRAEAGPSMDAFEAANDAASEATDREMAIENVTREANLTGGNESGGNESATADDEDDLPTNGTGTLRLGFEWTAFGVVEDDRIRVSDAFNTTSGTWLPGLTQDQRLVVYPPPEHGVQSAPVGPVNDVLTWRGPTTFEPGEITITYRERGMGDIASGEDGLMTTVLGGTALVLVVAVIGGYALRRNPDTDALGGLVPWAANRGTSESSTPPAAVSEGVDAPDSGGPDDAETGPMGGPVLDDELLSDEERVERLLEYNDGRMRQADIVTETGWSNAKVSQLLSSMDEEDRVDKLRIGRENLISLPDAEDDNGRS